VHDANVVNATPTPRLETLSHSMILTTSCKGNSHCFWRSNEIDTKQSMIELLRKIDRKGKATSAGEAHLTRIGSGACSNNTKPATAI
jgi:hypothetical protein